MIRINVKTAAAVTALALLLWPSLLLAEALPVLISAEPTVVGPITAAEDTDYEINGITMRVLAGSTYDSIEATETALSVEVPLDEAAVVRTLGPWPKSIENNIGIAPCQVIKTRDNQIILRGPISIQMTPGEISCSTSNSSSDSTPFINVDGPMAGTTLNSGDHHQLFWYNEGTGSNVVRIRLSVDGGRTYDRVLADKTVNGGFLDWAVPMVYTTEQARLKVEGMDGSGFIKSISLSPTFGIKGEDPPEPEPPVEPSWNFDSAAAMAAAESVDVNQGWSLPEGQESPECAGMRIKTAVSPAVYYCGNDGKRHAFPNERIHASWHGETGNWGGVVEVSEKFMSSLPLGANVTYRPGVRMVKLQTDPKTYAVGANGTLRWVPSEAAAVALYGADWNTKIDDLSDAFFADYTIGEPVALE